MKKKFLPLLATMFLFASVSPTWADDNSDGRIEAAPVSKNNGRAMDVPLLDFPPPPYELRADEIMHVKAATDGVTVFRPLPVCRLVDTRGGAPITGGPLTAGSKRAVTAANICGLPSNNMVLGLSANITVFNYTPNNGGYLAFMPTITTPVTGVALPYTVGLQWLGSPAIIPSLGSSNFAMYTENSKVDVIIDINGYYQDLNSVDTDTELDIIGNSSGDLFQVSNTGTGAAIAASASGGTGIRLKGGKFGVNGVTSGSSATSGSAVFTHTVTAASIVSVCTKYSNIEHPMLNNQPNARILVLPFRNINQTADAPQPILFADYVGSGNSCAANQWRLGFANTAAVGDKYTIMVISP